MDTVWPSYSTDRKPGRWKKWVAVGLAVAALAGGITAAVYALQARNPGPGAHTDYSEVGPEREARPALELADIFRNPETTGNEMADAVSEAFIGANDPDAEVAEKYRKWLFSPKFAHQADLNDWFRLFANGSGADITKSWWGDEAEANGEPNRGDEPIGELSLGAKSGPWGPIVASEQEAAINEFGTDEYFVVFRTNPKAGEAYGHPQIHELQESYYDNTAD